ncbi:MAG: thiamine-phosphate synthase family protein [Candidatus Hodarchaeales archaeon]
MQFICEIVPSNFLTPLRRTLAQELSKMGYVQMEISQILGVSQPVISSYLKAPMAEYSPINSRLIFKELVSAIISRIESETASPLDLMEIICKECQQHRTAGPICDIHRKKTQIDFPSDCNICFPSPQLTEVFDQKLRVTKKLYQAANELVQAGEKFSRMIPEIGCQFVYIMEDAKNPADIAGFPGRIIKVKERGTIISYPEFGQGAILAHILYHFYSHGSNHRSLISLKNTEEILRAIEPEKNLVQTEEADTDWNKTLISFTTTKIQQIEIIADTGGLGLEPIIYLFGKDPAEITNFLLSKY